MRCLICNDKCDTSVSWQILFQLNERKKICQRCEAKLKKISGEICSRCGRPFASLDARFRDGLTCTDCSKWANEVTIRMALEKNRSVYVYDHFLQELIARWKFRGDTALTEVFVPPLKSLIKKEFATVDVVVPIPLAKERLIERGFNQAQLVAEQLSNQACSVLTRPKESAKQSKKSRHERLSNEVPFQIAPNYKQQIINKSVLLIDDIYTTGATLHAAASVLKLAGAKKVNSITIARG